MNSISKYIKVKHNDMLDGNLYASQYKHINSESLILSAVYGNKMINKSRIELENFISMGLDFENDIAENTEDGLTDWIESLINEDDVDEIANYRNDNRHTIDSFILEQFYSEKDIISDVNSNVDSQKLKAKKKGKKEKKIPLLDSNLSEFSKWIIECKTLKNSSLSNKVKKEKSRIDIVVQNSIAKSSKVVSESLAKLLANQGHISDAIEMYNQLSLLIPEKSGFFALQIENLKNQ